MAHRMKMETHDIPEWAIYYLAYGECDGLTEDEVDMLTAFIEFNFPMGYTMEVQWDNCNEFDTHSGTTATSSTRIRPSDCPQRPIRWTSIPIKTDGETGQEKACFLHLFLISDYYFIIFS